MVTSKFKFFNCDGSQAFEKGSNIRGDTRGGDLEDFYPDVCVEGLEKDPF